MAPRLLGLNVLHSLAPFIIIIQYKASSRVVQR